MGFSHKYEKNQTALFLTRAGDTAQIAKCFVTAIV
jgi:hypothetical protein